MQCDFLDYRGGILSGGYYCMKKEDYISTDTKNTYCDNSLEYRNCPIYRDSFSTSGCYLTSACVANRGLSDDCDELNTLRWFRDNYLKKQPNGEEGVKDYYDKAPLIVAAIDKKENKKEIYDKIYEEVIIPCVRLIKAGDNFAAYTKYKEMVVTLEKQMLTYL